jgi:putative endonuclease
VSPRDRPAAGIADRLRSPSQRIGDAAEARALGFLSEAGLELLERNVSGRFGEIDLIMREHGVIVFVEVRSRASMAWGGAAASVGRAKQNRLRRQAQRWLQTRYGDRWPDCRFDVCALEPQGIDWIRSAF